MTKIGRHPKKITITKKEQDRIIKELSTPTEKDATERTSKSDRLPVDRPSEIGEECKYHKINWKEYNSSSGKDSKVVDVLKPSSSETTDCESKVESPQTEDSLTVKMSLAFQDGEKYGKTKTLETLDNKVKERYAQFSFMEYDDWKEILKETKEE